MAQLGVYLAVHLCASASCLVDGHYGSSCCMCVRSTGITEVLELTSQGCRQRMHKWDFVLKALEFAPCPWWKQGRGQCTLQSLSELWAIRNEMITSDNLANDLHWGRGHIKLNELHQCTWFPGLSSHFSFFLYSPQPELISAEFKMFSVQENWQFSLIWLKHTRASLLSYFLIWSQNAQFLSFFSLKRHTLWHVNNKVAQSSQPKVSTD